MTQAQVRPARCPRCGARVLRDHDTMFCLVHGTVVEPRRAWDVADGRAIGEDQAPGEPSELPLDAGDLTHPWADEPSPF